MLAMAKGDSILYAGGLGMANSTTREPVTSKHLFRLGSITKSFTALAVLKLAASGHFRLDQTLRELAPEVVFENPYEQTDPVKLIHLLEHSAGFDDMRMDAVYAHGAVPLRTLEAVERHRRSLVSRWKPGFCSSYSNPGYAILGYLIERYTGMPYEQYVEAHILKPLGMHTAHFSNPVLFDSLPHAQGYTIGPKKALEDKGFPQIVGNAAGALCASAEDMAAWLLYLISQGRHNSLGGIDSAMLANARSTHSTFASSIGFEGGYGYGIYRGLLKASRPFYGHSGGIDGFISYYGYEPTKGVGFALSANAMVSIQEIVQMVADFLTNDVKREPFEPVIISTEQRDRWKTMEGYYNLYNHRQAFTAPLAYLFSGLEVSWRHDTLQLKSVFEPAEYYFYEGRGAFRLVGHTSASLFILSDSQPNTRLLIGEAVYDRGSILYPRLWLILWIVSTLIAMVLVFLGVVWSVMVLTKGVTLRRYFARMIPVGSVLSFLAVSFGIALMASHPASASDSLLATVIIRMGSIAFFVLAPLGVALPFFKSFQEPTSWIRILIISSSCLFTLLSWYLFYFGWIGTEVW